VTAMSTPNPALDPLEKKAFSSAIEVM